MGGTRERVYDVAMWAIPAGIVGARAYHVLITDPGSYFGPKASGDPLAFLKIWEGGSVLWARFLWALLVPGMRAAVTA